MKPLLYFVALFIFSLSTSSLGIAQTGPNNAAKLITEATQGLLNNTKGRYKDKEFDAVIEYEASAIDLNGDGQPEVFTKRYGGMFGQAGVEINLYIKNKKGDWKPQFGFPGDYKILPTMSKGYPDIEIRGPGKCFPIWRWNGQVYDLWKNCRP